MIDIFLSLLAALGIAAGLSVHAGAGTALVGKIDRMFEARYASRPLIVDAERPPQHKRA